MKEEDRFNPLNGFDFTVLNDFDYKEDAVREEMLYPIIKAIGYSSNGTNKIVRSRKLQHPFVSIGSQQKKIYIVPDYIMEIDGNPCWILEAKAPSEKIINSKHTEQAYSYAIHPEIRAKYYSLSNGREFLLYNIDEFMPILHFDMRLLSSYWDQLVSILSPETLVKNYKRGLSKDFGLHLKRLGFDEFDNLFFYDIPIDFIQKIENNLFTTATGIGTSEDSYCVSFDFNYSILTQLKDKIPKGAIEKLETPLKNNTMLNLQFADKRYRIGVKCSVGKEIQENDKELFLPLIISEII